MSIGKKIKEKRILLGLTQEELAHRLGYKSKSTINKIELGINDIPQSRVVEFANALKILMQKNSDIYGIFGGNINKNTKDQILSIFDDDMREKLVFTDFRSDIANVVKGIDYYAFPSHTEGLPTALLEAMALSRPIVAFDIAPMNNLLANNRGQCAKFLDAQDMAEKINAYIQDDDLARQCAENASTFVKENYDTQILKTYIKRLLESL